MPRKQTTAAHKSYINKVNVHENTLASCQSPIILDLEQTNHGSQTEVLIAEDVVFIELLTVPPVPLWDPFFTESPQVIQAEDRPCLDYASADNIGVILAPHLPHCSGEKILFLERPGVLRV